jgi:hypothetical protein
MKTMKDRKIERKKETKREREREEEVIKKEKRNI